jgi:hypothetical protein
MGNGSIPRFRNLISLKVSSEAVQFIGTKASGCPSWPGVIDSTKGRIHWRRPTAKLVSLATRWRTIHSDNPAVRGDEPFVTVAFALMGAYFVYCGFALKRLFRQRFRKDRRFQHDVTADISEEGVHVVTDFEDTHLKWSALLRFLESDRIFMFFHSELIFSVVPKRAFGAGEIEPFRELLRRKIVAAPASLR